MSNRFSVHTLKYVVGFAANLFSTYIAGIVDPAKKKAFREEMMKKIPSSSEERARGFSYMAFGENGSFKLEMSESDGFWQIIVSKAAKAKCETKWNVDKQLSELMADLLCHNGVKALTKK